MRINSIFLIVFTLIGINSAVAQYSEKISSGRPGQANGPFAVSKGVYQIQSGIDYNGVTSDFGKRKTKVKGSNQNSVIRLGFFEKTEFRLGYGYQIKEKFTSNITTEFAKEQSGFNDFDVGIRQNLIKQYGIIPAIGIQATVKFGGLDNYKRDKYNYEGKLLLQHKISDKLSLNTNFSIEYNDEIDYTFGRYVFSFGYNLTDRFSLVAEAYGTVDKTDTQVFFDGGFGYIIGNNLQLDIYGGYGQNTIGAQDVLVKAYFVTAGISFRIDTHD